MLEPELLKILEKVKTTQSVHTPRILPLIEGKRWAELTRYWIGHQYKPALRGGALVAHNSGENGMLITAFLWQYLVDPFNIALLDTGLDGLPGLTEEERLTIRIMQLYARAALCEQAKYHAPRKQVSMFSAGLDAANKILEIAAQLDDRPIQGMYRSMIGAGHASLRQLGAAEESFQKALKIRRSLVTVDGDIYAPDLALTLNHYGTLLREKNRLQEAQSCFDEGEAICRLHRDAQPDLCSIELGRALVNSGLVSTTLGAHFLARQKLSEALPLIRQAANDDPKSLNAELAMCLSNLGAVQVELDEGEEAIERLEEAEQLLKPLAAEQEYYNLQVGTVVNNLGLARSRSKKAPPELYRSAVEAQRRLAALQPLLYSPSLAAALTSLGTAELTRKDLDSAYRSLAEAEQHFRTIRDPTWLRQKIHCYHLLGDCLLQMYEEEGAYTLDECRRVLEQARTTMEELSSTLTTVFHRRRETAGRRTILGNLVVCCYLQWRSRNEDAYIERAIEIAEERRNGYVQELLSAEDRLPRAPHDVLERFRTLKFTLHEAEARWLQANEAISTDQGLSSHSRSLEAFNEAHREVERLRRSYEELAAEIRSSFDPDFEPDPQVESLSFEAIRSLLPDQNTCLAYYLLTPRHCVVCVVTAAGANAVELEGMNANTAVELTGSWFHGYSGRRSAVLETVATFSKGGDYGAQRPDWLRRITTFKKLVESGLFAETEGAERTSSFDVESALKEKDPQRWYFQALARSLKANPDIATLYPEWTEILPVLLKRLGHHFLPDPVMKLLDETMRCCVFILDQPLDILPFHALLPSRDGYLLDRCQVLYAPSASILGAAPIVDALGTARCLTVDNPTGDLIISEIEGELCRSHYHVSEGLTGETATTDSIVKRSNTSDVFHYCGHVRFKFDVLESGLVLDQRDTDANWLKLRQILRSLRLPSSNLTVVSGCDSGRFNLDAIQDLLGLPTGFLLAGARCVVTTLWEAYELPACLLMDRFHRGLAAEHSVAAALKEAQTWMRDRITSGLALRDEILPGLLGRLKSQRHREVLAAAINYYVERSPSSPPFSSPAYWAGWVAIGSGIAFRRSGEKPIALRANTRSATQRHPEGVLGGGADPPSNERGEYLDLGIESQIGDKTATGYASRERHKRFHYLKLWLNRSGLAELIKKESQRDSHSGSSEAEALKLFVNFVEQKEGPKKTAIRELQTVLSEISTMSSYSRGLGKVLLARLHLEESNLEEALELWATADIEEPKLLEPIGELASDLKTALNIELADALEETRDLARLGAYETALTRLETELESITRDAPAERIAPVIQERLRAIDAGFLPGQIVARCALGTANTNYGNWADGEHALRQAIALGKTMPPSEKAWEKLAFAHLMLQKMFVRRAISPGRWREFFTDAMRYLERGDPARALHRFESAEQYAAAAADDRLTAHALYGQATASIELGNFAGAGRLLDHAERLVARADPNLTKPISVARARVNREEAIPTLTWLHSTAVQGLLRGNAHRAQILFERALGAAREEGNQSAEAENALGVVGALSQRLRFTEAEQRMVEFRELLEKVAEREDRGKALSTVKQRLATALGAIDRADKNLDNRGKLTQSELLQAYLDAVVSATETTIRFHFAAAAEGIAASLDDSHQVHLARTMMAVALAETGECAEALSLLEGVIESVGDSPLGKHAAELLRRIDSPKGKAE